MKKVSVEVNDLVQVSFVESESSRAYSSRVEDLSGDDITIAWPTDGSTPVPFHKGEKISLTFTREDAVYGFPATVEETFLVPLPVLVVQQTGEIARIQRREYVRVQALLPIELTGSLRTEEEGQSGLVQLKTTTLDISGGGVALYHKVALPVGTVFEIHLKLPDSLEPVNVLGRVVRCDVRNFGTRQQVFRVGIMFTSISESAQSRIIRYVFKMQKPGDRS